MGRGFKARVRSRQARGTRRPATAVSAVETSLVETVVGLGSSSAENTAKATTTTTTTQFSKSLDILQYTLPSVYSQFPVTWSVERL